MKAPFFFENTKRLMPPHFNIYVLHIFNDHLSLQLIVQNRIVRLKVSQQLGWVLKVTNLRFASRLPPSLSGKIIRYSQDKMSSSQLQSSADLKLHAALQHWTACDLSRGAPSAESSDDQTNKIAPDPLSLTLHTTLNRCKREIC